jgi:predicted CxxxxCH...CXXCH cytochrome family protein
VACHRGDYDSEHGGTGFPTTCTACHSPRKWDEGAFDHQSISGGFQLIGIHAEKLCSACHDASTFEPIFDPANANDCVACHSSTFPAWHQNSAFPTDCASCHTPGRWTDGTFNHEGISGGFQLIGVHTEKPCSACHDERTLEPRFDPEDENDCVACHISIFPTVHQSNGYPTSCASCHAPTRWGDGTFNHDSENFPIFSGKHEGEWEGCSTCHTNPTNPSVFTCFNCHKHDKASADDDHSEVTGYSYVSSACLACHPNGTS